MSLERPSVVATASWALGIGGLGIVLGLINYLDDGDFNDLLVLAMFGAVVGAAGPWIKSFVDSAAQKRAQRTQALTEWFACHGYVWVGDGINVDDSPITGSTMVKRTDAISGTMSEFSTLIYNIGSRGDRPSPFDKESKAARQVLCLIGPQLPVSHLYVTKASYKGSALAALEGETRALSEGMKLVKTESTEFNDRFNVLVDKRADGVWIRRVFDPQTIDAMIQHEMWVPEIGYWAGSFWLWQRGHYSPGDPSEIERLYAWQHSATNLAAHLTRIS